MRYQSKLSLLAGGLIGVQVPHLARLDKGLTSFLRQRVQGGGTAPRGVGIGSQDQVAPEPEWLLDFQDPAFLRRWTQIL